MQCLRKCVKIDRARFNVPPNTL